MAERHGGEVNAVPRLRTSEDVSRLIGHLVADAIGCLDQLKVVVNETTDPHCAQQAWNAIKAIHDRAHQLEPAVWEQTKALHEGKVSA